MRSSSGLIGRETGETLWFPDRPSSSRPLGGTPPSERSRTRVLVVDDYAANVEMLSIVLGRLGYEVVHAESGRDAIGLIAIDPPDVVLMDVVMPGLSGLDALRILRNDPATVDLPVILVSGRGETDDIVEGLKLGANDYVTKPLDMPILQARLATQTALKRARDELKRTALLLSAELESNARELAMAAHVQRSILPDSPPKLEGLEVAWAYEPATEVGGDLFDVVPLGGGRTFLFVADAMGHGVQAALVAATVKATLAAHLGGADDLSKLLARLDVALGDLFDDRFVTAAACILDPAAGTLRYAVAGHPPILVVGPGGLESLSSGGLPLGTALGSKYQGGEIAIAPGTCILLYSDGIIEAEGPSGDQFSMAGLTERFSRLAGHGPAATVSALRRDLEEFRGDVSLNDDLTILAARLT